MNDKNKSLFRAILPWLAAILLLSSLIPLVNSGSSSSISYTEFVDIVDDEKIEKITVMPGDYVATVEGQYKKVEDGKEKTFAFKTNVPQTDEELNSILQVLSDKNVPVTILDAKSENMLMDMFYLLV